jgi:hypothetical protein
MKRKLKQAEETDSYLCVETNCKHWHKLETESMKFHRIDIAFLILTDSKNGRCE